MARESGTASEHIYKEIRSMIERGELKPGMRLIQRDLAKRLSTSNIPIVEAIRRLEHDGLVVSKPNCGAQVVDMSSVEEIESIIMIRSSLEQVAVRLCAVRATDEQRAKLKELAEKYKTSATAGDRDKVRDIDVSIHSFIAKCSGSRILARMISNSRVITNTMYNVYWLPPSKIVPDVHDDLVDAIVSGNADLSAQIAKAHIERSLSVLHRVAEERGVRAQMLGFPPASGSA
ncbi:GntR family transcriptional regulator [bacterium]|nr:GntR family transcriptional regulator [bacterium]